jgi:hypothetical protein
MAKPSLLSTRYCPRRQSGTDGRSLTGAPTGLCEVHCRSTGGQSLHVVTASLWQASSPLARAPGSCDPSRSSSQSQPLGMRLARSHASRGITDCICRLSERPSPMFAPCLLGCRGTAR